MSEIIYSSELEKKLVEALLRARKEILEYNRLSNGYPELEVVDYINEALSDWIINE